MDPSAVALVDELLRLLGAGGKRVRPALCLWAFRAAGGREGDPIVRVCGALELLHTSALVHDDLMDREVERRGVASSHVRFAEEAPAGADADGFGTSAAILVGDLALVLSERMIRTSGFGAGRRVASSSASNTSGSGLPKASCCVHPVSASATGLSSTMRLCGSVTMTPSPILRSVVLSHSRCK